MQHNVFISDKTNDNVFILDKTNDNVILSYCIFQCVFVQKRFIKGQTVMEAILPLPKFVKKKGGFAYFGRMGFQRELFNEYQHDRVWMVFFVWTKVALALEG